MSRCHLLSVNDGITIIPSWAQTPILAVSQLRWLSRIKEPSISECLKRDSTVRRGRY